MKTTRILVPMLALAFAAGSVTSFAAPGDKKARTEKKDGTPREVKMTKRMQEMMESATGKPLTPEQIKAVIEEEKAHRAAMKELHDKHHAKIAQALGITVEQLETAEKNARKRNMKPKADAAPATTAPAAETPAAAPAQ